MCGLLLITGRSRFPDEAQGIFNATRKGQQMITFRKAFLTALVFGAMAIATSAFAEETTYNSPKVGSQALDLCLSWGADCGKPAADAWCASIGYEQSTNHVVAPDIGATTPTRLLSTGAVCDQAYCDGFASVTCFKPDPVTQMFDKPEFNGSRLDYCVNWGVGCGEEAATAFCQAAGWPKLMAFSIDPDIGSSSPTRLIGTGAVCDQEFCDGFTFITCQN